jgi:hypothetical protein
MQDINNPLCVALSKADKVSKATLVYASLKQQKSLNYKYFSPKTQGSFTSAKLSAKMLAKCLNALILSVFALTLLGEARQIEKILYVSHYPRKTR